MLFNSIDFALFFPLIFIVVWFIFNKNLRTQNIFLLAASYFFYACWDWRFLFLLMFSTFLDYFTAIKMENSTNQKTKKIWFTISVLINLGFLGFFKYFNFFAESFESLFASFGFKIDVWTLKVILPVGISFYTFHGLSYVIDIYYSKIKAEKNIIDYSLFVSFFPLLVAGPIERATHLLPQIKNKRVFNYEKGIDGLKQILWGLFKKMVIADTCAEYSNLIFNNFHDYSGATLFLGALFFTFQIYGDFSGYSDIALGTARLLGFDLLRNFAFPYFSRDIAEFWRRWHISLSTWFRDYLYIPLGGSKVSSLVKIRNTFIIFLVSGFWHGANWTFIFWGLLNAIFIIPSIINNTNRKHLDIVAINKIIPSIKESIQMLSTFTITVFAWIFFRSDNLKNAFNFIENIFTGLNNKQGYVEVLNIFYYKVGLFFPLLFLFFIITEWIGRTGKYAIESSLNNTPKFFRWFLYLFIIYATIIFGGSKQIFIYFQF